MFRNRLLIIDDEPDSVYILRFALERAGYEVVSAGSLREALPLATQSNIDLVLLDLVLNDGSGLDICRALRDNPATINLPIILVTGKLRTEFNTIEGFKAGADDYIMKPFRPAEVVARVEALLERTRRLRDASPVTGLPGPLVIQAQMRRLLSQGTPWGVLTIDLDDFRIYNDLYGFDRGDEVLRMVTHCIRHAAKSDAEHFIGHAGADNFIVTTTPSQLEAMAQTIMADFDRQIGSFYPTDAARRGRVRLKTRRGGEKMHPLLSVSISGVTNEIRQFHNPLEIAAVAAEVKRALKSLPGSNYLKDRRTEREKRAIDD